MEENRHQENGKEKEREGARKRKREKEREEKTKERIEGTRVIGPDEEGGKGRKDNVLIRTGDKEEITKEVQGAMDAARKKMLKK